MSGKRRQLENEARRLERERREKDEAVARGVAVDPAALAPSNSYDAPAFKTRGYYVDEPFVCQSCGIDQVWTAEQQKWWYEVAKGDVFSFASRCRPCRRREKELKEQARLKGGDPNPFRINEPGVMLARVRPFVEPVLLAAGFQPVDRNRAASNSLDYTRSEELISMSWKMIEKHLVVEWLSSTETVVRTLAWTSFAGHRWTDDIDARLGRFAAELRAALEKMSRA